MDQKMNRELCYDRCQENVAPKTVKFGDKLAATFFSIYLLKITQICVYVKRTSFMNTDTRVWSQWQGDKGLSNTKY